MRKVKSTLFQNLESVAMVLRALSNSSRLRITLALLDAELSVATLEETLEIKQPNLSQQLAELRKADILKARRSAKSVFYSIADSKVREIIALIAANMADGGSSITTSVASTGVSKPAMSTVGAISSALSKPGAVPTPAPVPAAATTWQGEEAQFAQVWPLAGH